MLSLLVNVTIVPGKAGFEDELTALRVLAGVMLAVVVGWVRE
jgi:uncharacterized membrane protein YraQ (UPF0718 family)